MKAEKNITLLETRYDYHVSATTIKEFEETFIETFRCERKFQQPFKAGLKNVYRLSDRFDFFRKIFDKLFSFNSSGKNYFVVLMGIEQIRKTYPYFLFTASSKSLYLFDCWEKSYSRTAQLIQRHNINPVFFSAKQSTQFFQNKFPDRTCIWIPEAINAKKYKAISPNQKTIDVIQIGRRYDKYHDVIAPFCEKENISYLYEKVKGQVIFPNQQDFINALAKTKISICFPSTITHPERSGNVSTMAVRYLQSMASKCLIIGSMPEDMKEHFDYMPIIEADMSNPAQQLKDILANYETYQSLIEKNYHEVVSKHQWINRMEIFKKYM